MKALFKKLALLALAIVMALCVGLAACDTTEDPPITDDPSEEPQNITYTITAACEDALILGGMKVQLKNGTTVAGEGTFKGGVATFSLPAATYSVDIVERENFEGFLARYRWSMATVTPESPNATITILSVDDDDDSVEKVTYTLTLLYPDNTPAGNVMVQLCGGPSGMCNPKKTDTSGVAVFELAAGTYEVHIAASDWPSGYTFDDTKYTMGAEGGSLTVYLNAA